MKKIIVIGTFVFLSAACSQTKAPVQINQNLPT